MKWKNWTIVSHCLHLIDFMLRKLISPKCSCSLSVHLKSMTRVGVSCCRVLPLPVVNDSRAVSPYTKGHRAVVVGYLPGIKDSFVWAEEVIWTAFIAPFRIGNG